MTKLSFVNLWLVSSKVTRWSWAKLHEHFFLSSFSKASTQVSMKDETLIRRGERFYQIQGLADLEFLILIHISVFHCVPLRSTRWSPDVAWARGWLWLPLHKLAAGNAVRRFPEFLAMSDVRSSSAWVSSVESATLMVSRLGNSVEQPSATERRTWSLPPSNLNVHNCAFQKKGWGGGEGKSAADEKRRMQEDLVYLGLPVQFFPDKIVGLCQVTYLARTVSPGALSSWRNQCPVSFLHILQPPSSTRDSWRGGGDLQWNLRGIWRWQRLTMRGEDQELPGSLFFLGVSTFPCVHGPCLSCLCGQGQGQEVNNEKLQLSTSSTWPNLFVSNHSQVCTGSTKRRVTEESYCTHYAMESISQKPNSCRAFKVVANTFDFHFWYEIFPFSHWIHATFNSIKTHSWLTSFN